MTTNHKNRVSLGRRATAKTFTRNSNKPIQARNGRQASTQSATTQPSCVAESKNPPFFSKYALLSLSALFLALLVFAAPATAAPVESPWWHLDTSVRPANLAPGAGGTLVAQAFNVGNEPAKGPIALHETLPSDVTVQSIEFHTYQFSALDLGPAGPFAELHLCSVGEHEVTCTTLEGLPEKVLPYEYLELNMKVQVASGGTGGEARTEISGGGAPTVSAHKALTISAAPATFGTEAFSIVPEEAGGVVDTQAGSHPYQLTTTFNLDQTADTLHPPALPRDLAFRLPAGLVGNATALPQCSDLEFRHVVNGGFPDQCQADTVVGVASVTVDEPSHLELKTISLPLFNLVPERGEPARFGFEILGTPVTLDTAVRSGSDYGVTVNVKDITQLTNFLTTTVVFWGVPGDESHNNVRGWNCLFEGALTVAGHAECPTTTTTNPAPFLTLPTSCSQPFQPSVEGSSWPTKTTPAGEPETLSLPAVPYTLADEFGRTISLSGCNRLPFSPFLETSPDVQDASSPSGLTVHVRVPQEASENGEGLAGSAVKDITVALPAGMQINPSGGDGLEGCGEGQVGFEAGAGSGRDGFQEFNRETEPGVRTPLFTPTLPEPLSPGLNLGAEGFCPSASKVATVKIKSPLIANPLEGSVYLATQNQNPFGSLIAMYIVAEDPVSGTVVKLPGQVHLSPAGQVTATFENEPQLPFEDAEIHFFGGERAPLATPAFCRDETPEHPGDYESSASFTPWSAEPGGEAAASRRSSSTFAIVHGPNGGACPGASLPFAPSLTAGMSSTTGGAFGQLSTTIGREDGEQSLSRVVLRFPPGLSGILAGVKLCSEAQANAGTCGPESLIGETTVSAGVGSDPATVVGGKVYLTEKYGGAPFGLSIVNPVKAGPFDLEHDTSPEDRGYLPACDCIVVRAKIAVDPHTAALTVSTNDAAEGYAIPSLIDGIPVQIKKVNVLINRPGFTFNPTDCAAMKIEGAIASGEGASTPVSVPFQVANCATLKFAPKFTVSTAGKNSKAGGATLTAKLSEPTGALGTQANITRVKVDLPKQLPSRLTTLQKACTDAQFEANPANCPKESKIGYAKVTTPLLPVPLEGPAIFVSHGGEAFPSLTMVLQGYGVTVDLVGTTFISSKGITSTTFKTVPDVPFSTFTLTLPQGKFSALAANVPTKDHYSLCGQTLTMPTEFLAQNGAKINQSTPVGVTGCAKAKTLTRAQKLTKALKACKQKAKSKRSGCEKTARKEFGPVKTSKKKKK
jgi:hypothetical protein